MYGVFINGRRPKSKKEIKEAVAEVNTKWMTARVPMVSLEATSMFGNEYDGDIMMAPNGTYTFVGPDPYTKRSFYGTLTVNNGTFRVK